MSPYANDENTRAAARAVSDQVATLFTHFLSSPDASWDDFTQASSQLYLERLKLGLDLLSTAVYVELVTRNQVEPTDLGI